MINGSQKSIDQKYRSIDSFILYGIYDHMFITLDIYKNFVKTYEEEGLWEDCIIQMNGEIVVGKISYERFVSYMDNYMRRN